MSQTRVELLNAYRDTSIYTVNALKSAIEDMRRRLEVESYKPETRRLIQERLETLQINLEIIELDPE